MALESFYGGRQGVSPVIKARFEFITKEDEAYQAKKEATNQLLTDWEKHILAHNGIVFDPSIVFNSEDSISNNIYYDTTAGNYRIKYWVSEELNLNYLDYFVMDEQFKKVDYTDVWYDELCIIDTPNKMNPNNGKIFRRTLKRYQNPTLTGISDERALYAEYVGQIVGPSGGVPNLVFGNLDDVRKDAAGRYNITIEKIDSNDPEISELKNELTQEEYDNLSSDQQSRYHFVEHYYNVENWDYLYPDANETKNSITSVNIRNDNDATDDYQHIAILNSGDNSNITIVPGKDENNSFNDNIRYTWCNVRRNLNHAFHDTANPDYEDEAWIYLGFEIPYTFWDVSATHIPYWLNTQQVGNIVDIQKLNETDDDSDHPFYHNLHFYIPRGTRGIGPEEIILVKSQINNGIKTNNHPKDNNNSLVKLYNIEDILYDSSTDMYSLKQNASEITSLPDSYWIAKWTLYNPEQKAFNGSATNSNFTNNIESGDNSTYTEVWIYLGEYQDVKSIQYEDTTGKIKIEYSNDLNNWVPIDGEIDYAKTLRVETNKASSNYGKIYKVSNISSQNNTRLSNETPVNSFTGDILPLIKSVKTNDNGTLTFNYSGMGDIIADGKIREIVDFSTNSNGELLIHFNEKLHEEDNISPNTLGHYVYNFGNIYGNTLTGMNNIYFGEEGQNNSITQTAPDQNAINITVTFFKSSGSNNNGNLIEIWENPSNNSNGS